MGSERFGISVNPIELAARVNRITDGDVYNWKDTNTRRLQRSMAAAKELAGYSDHVFLGDGQTYRKDTPTWVTKLRDRLDVMGYPIAGTGWVRSNDGSAGYDTRISKTGTWTIVNGPGSNDLTGYTTSTAAGTMTFASNRPGPDVAVSFLNTSAPFTFTIDGGSPVTITPDGTSTVGVHSETVTDAKHTLVVTTSSATPVHIVGFRCDRTTGVRLHNQAGLGWEAEGHYSNPGATYPSAAINAMLPDGPDVIHAAFGMGDIYRDRPASQLVTDLNYIRSYFPDSDFILYLGMEPSVTVTAADADLSKHARALYDVADELDVPFINVWRRSGGSYAKATEYGLMADTQNPSAAGHQLWAEVPARLMASLVGSGPNLTANNFIAARTPTATAATTTTLTISDSQEQVFTGSTTQTVKLPTTSVVAGQTYTVNNQSSGIVTVQSSGASLVLALPASRVATFKARVDTPTSGSDWVVSSLPVLAAASNVSIAQRDGNANLSANAFLPSGTPITSAAGTTALTVSSTQLQVVTGSTTQTITLPTTSVAQFQSWTVVNTSSGNVTVNSSAGNLVKTLTTGQSTTVRALQATPTADTHWHAT